MFFDNQTVKRARQTNLVDYCEYKGFDMEYEDNGNYRLKGNSGLIIKENYFKQFGKGNQGNALDFCTQVLGMKFRDAVNELLTFKDKDKDSDKTEQSKEIQQKAGLEKKKFMLPEKSSDNKRVYSYLTKTRGLPGDLINDLLDGNFLYQQEGTGNCVFVCYDDDGQPQGAILRGTSTVRVYKGMANGSNASYGWLLKPEEESNIVVVAESPIDVMSVIALSPKAPIRKQYILALGGLNFESLKRFLEKHSSIKEIILALDNDEPATKAMEHIKAEFCDRYKIIEYRPKKKKDWNEELLSKTI